MDPVTILFGTESGNAQSLAKRAGEDLAQAGIPARVIDMMDFDHAELSSLVRVLIITSTYGNGDPPSNAEALHAYVMKLAPPLPKLRYSVCSLGDTTYDRFANCGREFDERLEELGAVRVAERRDCDIDYDDPFEEWLGQVIVALKNEVPAAETSRPASVTHEASHGADDPPGTRRNPVLARVIENRNLNLEGAQKRTHHLVLDIEGLPIPFVVGDSIGIWPDSDPALVRDVLAATGHAADVSVLYQGKTTSLGEVLRAKLDLRLVDARLVKFVDDKGDAEANHVIDLLERAARKPSPAELVDLLRPQAPRLYSIASSSHAIPGQVHLLIDILSYELAGKTRFGTVAKLVAERCPVGTELPIYLHPAPSFRIGPADQDFIMIGPGTGVAPFRAFLQEREALGHAGKNWLFFGSQHEKTDFLYREDWQAFAQRGALTKLSVAFSRDQAQKIYVQDRMREEGAELVRWIEGGAAVYVCGDKDRMAAEVHETLVALLCEHLGFIEAQARQRLDQMAGDGRYQRDVY